MATYRKYRLPPTELRLGVEVPVNEAPSSPLTSLPE